MRADSHGRECPTLPEPGCATPGAGRATRLLLACGLLLAGPCWADDPVADARAPAPLSVEFLEFLLEWSDERGEFVDPGVFAPELRDDAGHEGRIEDEDA